MAKDIQAVVISVSPVGSAGSASGSGVAQNVNGFLMGVNIDYTSQHANTDVTLKINAEQTTILTISNTNTDGFYNPLKQACDSTGTAVSGVYTPYPISGPVSVTVAQGSEVTNGVVITLYIAPN